ncbi:AMP-binding enzyme family protein [Histomonas meleagridis]|uniref:AMP-binding enzyme family protein n=1 Tax=Histomonas meleagridis TaxID=135588 RepID=UPI00355A8683|nr:AMP-binding enzyme family protein [Histomonas meleagridis]KAH0796347.1 AMP-binding enzyme family protein [Histomonas meleagridis]
MGSEPSKTPNAYCTLVSPPTNENESGIYINSNRLNENFGEPIRTFQTLPSVCTIPEIIECGALKYKERDCVGERTLFKDGSFGKFKWISYNEFYKKCLNFAAGLQSLGIKNGDKVAIYSKSCIPWQISQFGIQFIGAIPVVIPGLLRKSLKYIISHASCKALIIDGINAKETNEIFSEIDVELKITFTHFSNESYAFDDIIQMGIENKNFQRFYPSPEDTSMIMYNYGSDDKPKGCILTHQSIIAGSACLGAIRCSVTTKDTYFSYLPLAHIFEYSAQLIMFVQGARIGFYTGTSSQIFVDCKELQPTIMCGVPRIFNRIYDAINEFIKERPFLVRAFITWTLKYKNESLMSGDPHSFFLDIVLLKRFKDLLGGRVKLLICGGAPLISEVFDLIRAAITPNILMGYGLTETCASGCVQEVGAQHNNSVGPVSLSIDMKFRAVEGMNYDPRSESPSGELMFRGPPLFSGYYHDSQKTSESFIDGWYATGDIGILTSDGQVQIIDRVRQVVKLSHGEFISLSNLHEIYSKAYGVKSIFVYADSHHSHPVAVVVPTERCIKDWDLRLGISSFVDSKIAKREMLGYLKERATAMNLRSSEHILNLILENQELIQMVSKENEDSTQNKNQVLRAKYESRLLELYDEENIE